MTPTLTTIEHVTKTDPQTRHARYVQELAHKLADAKAELATVRSRMWQHSGTVALMSRMTGQEQKAEEATEAYLQLKPQYFAALGKVGQAAEHLTESCIGFSQKWGRTHEAWLTPECTHGLGRHAFHTWRIPNCVLCRAGENSVANAKRAKP